MEFGWFARPAIVSSISVLALLAACSSAPPKTDTGKKSVVPVGLPSINAIPVITDVSGLSLPVDAYLLTFQERATLNKALDRLTGQCMNRFGFKYMPSAESPNASSTAVPSSNLASRYGVVNVSIAAQHGYHFVEAVDGGKIVPPPMSDVEMMILDGDQGAMSQADLSKSPNSSGKKYGGQQIPDHGCMGEAYRGLYVNGGSPEDAPLATRVLGEGYDRSRQDDRVKSAFSKWSDCMNKHGYNYADPLAVANAEKFASSASPSSDEIVTAKTDVNCKREANVVGIWFTVESSYEKAAIQQNIEAFQKIKDSLRDELEYAAKVLYKN